MCCEEAGKTATHSRGRGSARPYATPSNPVLAEIGADTYQFFQDIYAALAKKESEANAQKMYANGLPKQTITFSALRALDGNSCDQQCALLAAIYCMQCNCGDGCVSSVTDGCEVGMDCQNDMARLVIKGFGTVPSCYTNLGPKAHQDLHKCIRTNISKAYNSVKYPIPRTGGSTNEVEVCAILAAICCMSNYDPSILVTVSDSKLPVPVAVLQSQLTEAAVKYFEGIR